MLSFEKELRRSLIGTSLGVVRFFEPTENFVTYMRNFEEGTPIFDVGAGAGHVTKKLADAGMKVAAIDMHRHAKPVTNVHMADGTDFPYTPDSVVMLCRPCHGAFVEQVILQADICNADVVLYVGLERNVEEDLGDFFPHFKVVATEVGKEGEAIWRMDLAKRLHQRLGVASPAKRTSRKARSARA